MRWDFGANDHSGVLLSSLDEAARPTGCGAVGGGGHRGDHAASVAGMLLPELSALPTKAWELPTRPLAGASRHSP